jgi:hypothetical protein
MSVNGLYDLKLFSHMKQHSYSAMTITSDSLRNAFSQSFEEILSPPQVCQNNGSGFTVDPSGLNDAPVGFASGLTFLEGSHISVYISLFIPPCQAFFNI